MDNPQQPDRRTSLQVGCVCLATMICGCGRRSNVNTNPLGTSKKELLLTGGQVVLAEETQRLDIRISGDTIAEIGKGLRVTSKNSRVIDCDGKHLLPGGIDPHVHLAKPWCDDFRTGSQAALAGGITSLGHMSFPVRGQTLRASFEMDCRKVEELAIADFFFHYIASDPGTLTAEVCQDLLAFKQPSLKVYMLTKNFADAPNIADQFRLMREHGLVALVHAEDFELLNQAKAGLMAKGKTSLSENYAASRPVAAEVQAVKTAIQIANESGCAVYLVHLSSRKALELAAQAQKAGTRLFVESRPMYLHLTDEIYRRKDAPLFVGMPPVRSEDDQAAAWEAIASGCVQTVASDHAPWTRKQKLQPDLTIENPRGGVNNLQVMLPMLMNEVSQGRITLQQFAKVTSYNAADIFGLLPRKGELKVGADGDVVIWDLKEQRTISDEGFSNAGFSIYQGTEVTGWPLITIRRGEVVFENGEFSHQQGGQVLNRAPFRSE